MAPIWYIPADDYTRKPPKLDRADRVIGRDVRFDGNLQLTAAGDYVVDNGRDRLKAWLYRAWAIEAGEYAVPGRENFGAGARTAVKRPATKGRLAELRARMEAVALTNPAVESVEELIIQADSTKRNTFKIYAKIRSRGELIRYNPITIHVGA